jgi:hypothetical protein
LVSEAFRHTPRNWSSLPIPFVAWVGGKETARFLSTSLIGALLAYQRLYFSADK